MPAKNVTLIVEEDPLPEQASEIFNVVLRDSMEQSAMEGCLARSFFHNWSNPLDQALLVPYVAQGFLAVVHEDRQTSELRDRG